MTLKINKMPRIAKRISITTVIILILGFFVRTLIWEQSYLNDKIGSKRAEAAKTEAEITYQDEEEVEVDEVEPTPQQVIEYTVPASHPRYITIETLGNVWNRQVISVGLKNGQLDTPRNVYQAGWYNESATPGSGGTLVIDGHNGGPNSVGIFKHLPKLTYGDKIKIERGDGAIFIYSVIENEQVPLDNANDYMKKAFKSPIDGKESLTIISCSGEWSQTQRTYLSRQFVRAVLED